MQALINGYLREIDPAQFCQDQGRERLAIDLTHCGACLFLDVQYRSQTGPHTFGSADLVYHPLNQRHPAAPVQIICLIAQECAARIDASAEDKLPEFLRCIFNSNAEIETLLAYRSSNQPMETFLQVEQGLTFGHWLHPTPKSRDGMTFLHKQLYAPEQKGAFRLSYFAVSDDLVISDSAEVPPHHIVTSLLGHTDMPALLPNERLIPVHPLQADVLRKDPKIQDLLNSGNLRDLGLLGRSFYATSSVRTLYAPDCPWMVKFSIPVRLTNSLRVTLRNELQVGVLMARLLRKLDFATQQPRFHIIDDPAYATVAIPGQTESGFETIFRKNPFTQGQDIGIFNLATLTADPPPRAPSLLSAELHRLSHTLGTDLHDAAKRWFKTYLQCMLDPLLVLYDQHGIALEAHQQNALLDLSSGLPKKAYFRDNQGYFITRNALPRLQGLEPGLAQQPALVFDEEHIHKRFAYYLFVNQIFAVVRRMGQDGILTEDHALTLLRAHLTNLSPQFTKAAKGFIIYLLFSPYLATKANLLTRLHDMDELKTDAQEGLFLDIPNPLFVPAATPTQEVADVFA
ncbi:Siderophore synthetase component [Epibacterium ulvae]|uniref:Siderophore synthetase component n=2 Tax=Epibacterium ulvae TaxID=1156985 RepID=A0A1G5QSD7_9RHOB|nr:Siderophore synthetase component [Epibacterium ulvae]